MLEDKEKKSPGAIIKTNTQVELIVYRETHEREFLLLHRVASKGGFWQPVTGGAHVGEGIEQTLRREALEELGLVVTKVVPTGFSFKFSDHGKDYVEHVYGTRVEVDTPIRLSPEHDDSRWLGYQEARALLKWETNKQGLDALVKVLDEDTKKS